MRLFGLVLVVLRRLVRTSPCVKGRPAPEITKLKGAPLFPFSEADVATILARMSAVMSGCWPWPAGGTARRPGTKSRASVATATMTVTSTAWECHPRHARIAQAWAAGAGSGRPFSRASGA